MSSDQWRTMGDFFFRPRFFERGKGQSDEFAPYQFRCDSCERTFGSQITPRICPHCKATPGAGAIELTHKEYTAKTFPFAV